MPTIRDVLASRSDLSTFLVHLTRSHDGITAKERLLSILDSLVLRAGSPLGQAAGTLALGGHDTDSQKVVCFTETPLEHVASLLGTIAGRQLEFEPYGVAITKMQGRTRGANPVWYVDITPGHDWLTESLNQMVDSALATGSFDEQPIAQIAPFIEQMGTGPMYRKEFWWEREWRYRGSFALPTRYIVLCPEAEHEEFRELSNRQSLVDPRWSLEEIIARLARFQAEDVSPF